MASTSKIDKKVNEQKKKVNQAVAELKKLRNLQKASERKMQAERAGNRGVLFEKMLPDVTKLDDTRFRTFLERTVANDFGKRTLATILSDQAKVNAHTSTPAPAPGSVAQADKPAATPQRADPVNTDS